MPLDRTRPFATVQGPCPWRFEQDGLLYLPNGTRCNENGEPLEEHNAEGAATQKGGHEAIQ
jgi:hypothetical protein